MRQFLINAVVVLCSLIFCLVLGEVAVRGLYPWLRGYHLEMWRYFAEMKELHPHRKLSFSHFPNRRGVYCGAEIVTNASGFRDREFPTEKQPGKTRMVFLGDSFTLGWGVPFEETFETLVEKKLNEGGDHYESINLGVGNYNTTMELELLRWKGLPYQPDAVVLVFFVNDTEPIPRLSRLSYHVRRNSYLFALLYDRVLRFKASRNLGPMWKDYYQSLYHPQSPYLAENTESVRELARLCRENGIQLFIVNYPDLHQLKDYPFDQATRYIQSLAEELQVPFLDLAPFFEPYEPASLWVSDEDTHGNAKASAIVAEAIYGWLRGLLPPQPAGVPMGQPTDPAME